MTPAMHRRGFIAAAILCGWLIAGPHSADTARAGDSPEIRGAARKILSSPEFRNLRMLKRKRGAPTFRKSGDGDGRAGDGEGEGRHGEGRFGEEGDGRFGDPDDDWKPGRGEGGRKDVENKPPSDRDESADESSSREIPQSTGLGNAIGGFMSIVSWIFVAIVVSVIVVLIAKGLIGWIASRRNRVSITSSDEPDAAAEGELETETAPGELPADVYVAQARELAAAGQYREAVAQLLLGAMSSIERAGLLRYRKGLTCRDYTRAVRGRKRQFQAMKAMVRVYEPLGFGRRVATREHFEKTLSGYQAGFRATRSAQ